MSDLDTLFGELRSIFAHNQGWPALQTALEPWEHHDAFAPQILPYCLSHTTSWGPFPAPLHWLVDVLEGREQPLLGLCDAIVVGPSVGPVRGWPRAGLGPQGLARLLERAPLTRLRVLTLDGQALGDAGVHALTESELCEDIEQLSLMHNDVGSLGVSSLIERTGGWPRLIRLRLSGNAIGEGLSLLTRYPRVMPALERIDAADCRLRDEDVDALCAHPPGKSLQRISLDWNDLSLERREGLYHWATRNELAFTV